MENETTGDALMNSTRVHIADIDHSLPLSTCQIEAYVVLVWPYSSFTEELSWLLAERDVNLRQSTGQIKVTFHGTCAKEIAKSKIGISEDIKLGLRSAQVVEGNDQISTPGKKAAYTLHYHEAVELQVQSGPNSVRHITFAVEKTHTPASTSAGSGNAVNVETPQKTRILGSVTHAETARSTSHLQTTTRLSSNSFPGSFVDPFTEEDGYTPGRGRKRTKFARFSGGWRFADSNEDTRESIPAATSETENVDLADRLHQPANGTSTTVHDATPLQGEISVQDTYEDAKSRPSAPESEYENISQSVTTAATNFDPVPEVIATIEHATPVTNQRSSLGSENMPTPRLHALASPGLPLVSPLYTRAEYFPSFERQMSELDASSQVGLPQEVKQDKSLSVGDPDEQVQSLLGFDTTTASLELQKASAVETIVPFSAALEAEVDLDALHDQISFELNNNAAELGEAETETVEDEDLYGPPLTQPPLMEEHVDEISQNATLTSREHQEALARGSTPGVPIVLEAGESEDEVTDGDEEEEEEEEKEEERAVERPVAPSSIRARGDELSANHEEEENEVEGEESEESSDEVVSDDDPHDRHSAQFDLQVHKADEIDYGKHSALSIDPVIENWQNPSDPRYTANDEIQVVEDDQSLSTVPDVIPTSWNKARNVGKEQDSHPSEQASLRKQESSSSVELDVLPRFLLRSAQTKTVQNIGFGFGLDRFQEDSTKVEVIVQDAEQDSVKPATPQDTQLGDHVEDIPSPASTEITKTIPLPGIDAQNDMLQDATTPFWGDATRDDFTTGNETIRRSRRSMKFPGRTSYPDEIYSEYFTPRRPASNLENAQNEINHEKLQSYGAEIGGSEEVTSQIVPSRNEPEVDPVPDEERPPSLDLRRGTSTGLTYLVHLASLHEYHNQLIDVLAVAASTSPLPERAKTGPKDYFTTTYLVDASLEPDTSISVQVFRPRKNAIPTVKRGDVMLLRNFKVQSQKRKPFLLSNDESAWAVFSRIDANDSATKSTKVVMSGPPLEYGGAEEELVQDGLSWWQADADQYPGPQSASSRGEKGKQIQVPASSYAPEPRRSPRKTRSDRIEAGPNSAVDSGRARSPSFVLETPSLQYATRSSMPPPSTSKAAPPSPTTARHARRPSIQSTSNDAATSSTTPRTPSFNLDGIAASSLAHDDSANSESTTTKRHRRERRSTSLIHELRDGTQWVDVEEAEIVSVTTSEEDENSDHDETTSVAGTTVANAKGPREGGEEEPEADDLNVDDQDLGSSPASRSNRGRPATIHTPGRRGRPRKSKAQRRASQQSPVIQTMEGRATRSKGKAPASDDVNMHELRDGARYTDK